MSETRDVTRREAIKAASAVTAVAAASKLQGAPAIQKVKAANNQIQYGMIGTGSRGSYLLQHLTGVDNGKCVALCDIDDENLAKGLKTIGGSPKTYKDYRELLADSNVEAVLVVTPLFMHFPITKDVLMSGKHVFCEKSLVFRPEEVHELRKLATERAGKQILQVGLQRRYSRYYQAVRDMIDKGVLGDVTHVQAQWNRNPGWTMKPHPDPAVQKRKNWRLYREFSGGLTAELASHQIDIADWMFGSQPEYVIGVGGKEWVHDGRDVYDNIQLIYKYPKGQKLIYTSISTNSHLAEFGATRTEFGEVIMGTAGTVEITVGTDKEAPIAIWFKEPAGARASMGAKPENTKAGATMVSAGATKGLPIVLSEDQVDLKNDSFMQREMKFARRWLYSKGVMVPDEGRNPVDVELESFFDSCKSMKKPKADLEVGLADSTAVILSNMAMDQERRVYFNEIEKMSNGAPTDLKKAAKTS